MKAIKPDTFLSSSTQPFAIEERNSQAGRPENDVWRNIGHAEKRAAMARKFGKIANMPWTQSLTSTDLASDPNGARRILTSKKSIALSFVRCDRPRPKNAEATGQWDSGQSIGRRWPIGWMAMEITQHCNLGCATCCLAEHSESVKDIQLQEIFRRFDIGESRNVQIDLGGRKVWLSAIFKFYTEDFTVTSRA